eukprot:6841048-Alexandrium_andersonii.AAC.1
MHCSLGEMGQRSCAKTRHARASDSEGSGGRYVQSRGLSHTTIFCQVSNSVHPCHFGPGACHLARVLSIGS